MSYSIHYIYFFLIGTGCIIISPTRELAIQTFSVLKGLMKYHHNLTHGIIAGGAIRQTEAQKLSKGKYKNYNLFIKSRPRSWLTANRVHFQIDAPVLQAISLTSLAVYPVFAQK